MYSCSGMTWKTSKTLFIRITVAFLYVCYLILYATFAWMWFLWFRYFLESYIVFIYMYRLFIFSLKESVLRKNLRCATTPWKTLPIFWPNPGVYYSTLTIISRWAFLTKEIDWFFEIFCLSVDVNDRDWTYNTGEPYTKYHDYIKQCTISLNLDNLWRTGLFSQMTRKKNEVNRVNASSNSSYYLE